MVPEKTLNKWAKKSKKKHNKPPRTISFPARQMVVGIYSGRCPITNI